MVAASEIASDITVAGTAFGGLLLVFIGLAATGYESFQPEDRAAVRGKFMRRSWLALSGFLFTVISTGLSLVAKAIDSECMVITAAICLLTSMLLVTATALLTVIDIR